MGVPIRHDAPADHGDLVIDAIIGYSLRGAPRDHVASLVIWANAGPAPVLSLDTPSGLDVTTGDAAPCVQADATMTLALPKAGPLDAPQVGRLFLADISVPTLVYERMGLVVGCPFAEHAIVELDQAHSTRLAPDDTFLTDTPS